MSASEQFVVYDRIRYTKKGWINRNRFLQNNVDRMFSLPLRHAKDGLDVVEREISSDFNSRKLLAQWRGAYLRAPHFRQTFDLMEKIVLFPDRNLFRFLLHSISCVANHLGIDTRITTSSELPPNATEGKGKSKVISICRAMNASQYINPVSGSALYDSPSFASAGIELLYLRPHLVEYKQFAAQHVPWLSILDVLMFVSVDKVRERMLPAYDIVNP